MSEGGELGARAHRAQHVAAHSIAAGAHLVCGLARQPGALLREFTDAVLDVVVGEVRQVAPEGVGLDGVRACREVLAVDLPQDVRPGVVEDFVAAFETDEVVESQLGILEHRAHRAVADDNAT